MLIWVSARKFEEFITTLEDKYEMQSPFGVFCMYVSLIDIIFFLHMIVCVVEERMNGFYVSLRFFISKV